MLQSIYVKDFVLLENISLQFQNGFSAFSGETGAGKSLLIDALSILKGERFAPGSIKSGKDKAIIEGVFDISKQVKVKELLNESGYDIEDDLLIVSRECNIDGKSKARINQRTTTLSFLKQIMNILIDIHSQHDSHALLNPKFHLNLLDQYCDNTILLQKCHDAFKSYDEAKKSYDNILNSTYDEDDLDLFTIELNKLQEVDIKENELETCEQSLKEMSSYEKVVKSINDCLYELNKDEGCLELLYNAYNNLSDDLLTDEYEQLQSNYYAIQDLSDTLKTKKDNMFFDEYEYQRLSDRLSIIKKIFRKYGSYEGYINRKAEIEEIINQILYKEQALKKQKVICDQAYQDYLKVADELHVIRQKQALTLESNIVAQLQALCLPNARFKIELVKTNDNRNGYDDAIFMIAMNPGEGFKKLSDTASGGEISRFMLGLKCVFADIFKTSTIIFDEIDTGVSGSVAFAIGQKMHELSNYTQVFAVTHLAQVAACADSQYQVSKLQLADSTSTKIHLLTTEEERIHELASISSATISETSIASARELFKQAHHIK